MKKRFTEQQIVGILREIEVTFKFQFAIRYGLFQIGYGYAVDASVRISRARHKRLVVLTRCLFGDPLAGFPKMPHS